MLKLSKNSNLEIVIIRPPLVYGNNAPGNFGRLIQWASAKIILPLPLGAVNNARSLIAIDNLVSFISLCIDLEKSSKASNQVFLICDCEDVSTTLLLKKVRQALSSQSSKGSKAWLLPVPVSIMNFLAKVLVKSDIGN